MVPHKLTLRNFMCYRDDVPPLFFEGINVACLAGENGAGKSTLLDAITWALWGRARSKSDDDLIALGQEDMEVDFEFVLDGTLQRVIRRRTRGKRGQTIVDFQVCDEGGAWRRIGGDTVRDTEARIQSALRMNYETFINSAFLLQGRADEFTTRKPAERKQVLADILGLAVYEDLEERAKERRKSCADELRSLEGVIETYEQQVARRPFLLEDLAHATANAEHWDAEVAAQDAMVQDLRAESARLKQVAQAREALDLPIQRYTTHLVELRQEIVNLEMRVSASETIVANRKTIEAGYAELLQLQARLAELEGLREEAYRLNDIKKEHDQALHEIRLRLEGDEARITDDYCQLEQECADAEVARAELERIEHEAVEFATIRDQVQALQAEQAGLEERLQRLMSLKVHVAELSQPLNDMRQALLATQSNLLKNITELGKRADRLPKLERELAETQAQLQRLTSETEQLATLREGLQQARLQRQRAQEQLDAMQRQGTEITEKLRLIETGEGQCPLCSQSLDHAGRQRLIDEYIAERATLRSDFRTVRGHLDEADDRIKEGEPAIARLEGVQKECTSLEARRATLKTQLEQVHADLASREEQEATCSTLEAQLADEDYGHAERDRLRQAETELAQLGSIEVTTEELERVRGSIRSAEKRLLAERALQERRAQAGARLRQAEAAIQRLPEVEARLADVRRALEQKDYGHAERAASESVLAQIKALGYTRAAHEELKQATMEQQSWGEKHARLGNALATLDDLRHTLRVHRELASRTETDLARAEAEAQAHDAELRKRQAVEYNLQEGERRLAEAKTQHQMAHKELGRATQELARCDEFAEVLESYRAQHAALSQKHGVYDELALAFGKKGVQAMLIETAIPELEHEANRLLARMTDNQMHLSFETQRDSKKGDTIETLDIRIADTLGTRDYAMFSGGEAFRVNFAVRIALSKLLARRADANLKTLVIDEGFGTQDNHGRDRIVEAIEAVSRDFERIIVITHIQELKDMFPTQIEITKGAQGSSWRVV